MLVPPLDRLTSPLMWASLLWGGLRSRVELARRLFASARGWLSAPSNGLAPGEGHVQVLGKVLFRDYLLPFEILSVILLAALFGLIVIGRRK